MASARVTPPRASSRIAMERGPLGPVALVLSNVRGEGRAGDALAAETARKPRVHGGCRREPHVVEAGAPCARIGGRLVGVVPKGGFVWPRTSESFQYGGSGKLYRYFGLSDE